MAASGPEKLFYLILGIIFLALGVVGLLIPILPGVLFLAGALYMLSRGSSRIRRLAEEHPRIRSLHQRMNRLSAVSALDRIRVTSLMTLQATVTGLQKLTLGVRRMIA